MRGESAIGTSRGGPASAGPRNQQGAVGIDRIRRINVDGAVVGRRPLRVVARDLGTLRPGFSLDNIGEVKPTLLFSVPRVFNKIYDGVEVDEAGLERLRVAARRGPLLDGEFVREDRDEDDVVDAEDDLEHRQRQE